jgi:hypothetical protein
VRSSIVAVESWQKQKTLCFSSPTPRATDYFGLISLRGFFSLLHVKEVTTKQIEQQ